MMEVQRFIAKKGWQALTDELGINVKRYDSGICVLNYDMIESPKNHPVSNECRGLTLWDKEGVPIVMSRSFSRFFNYGEADTKEFDFSNCTVWEKADGALTKVWYNFVDNRYEISTRGMAFAEGVHCFSTVGQEHGGSFREWILKAMNFTEEQFQDAMKSMPEEVTYVLEYTGPSNRIVTPYKEDQMVLLAVVGNDGIEEPLTLHHTLLQTVGMNVRLPQTYNALSAEEVIALCESLTELKEGFVVFDHNTGKRVKVKNAAYVAAHHLRGNGIPTQSALMELVLTGEESEFLAYFPEYQKYVDPIVAAKNYLLWVANSNYERYRNLETQKDFALAVKDLSVSSIMFKARKDNVEPEHAFNTMEVSQKVKLLEKFI